MQVNVKRNTGLMGGATKVTLHVDGQEVAKLGNREEHVINVAKSSIQIQAKSGFMGSRPLQVTSDSNIDIKVNPLCMFLFIASLVLIFTAAMTDTQGIKLIFAAIGVVGMVSTLGLSITSWFVLRK